MDMPSDKTYACEVKEVFSGDDLVLLVDLGVEGLWKRTRARLLGVDTPNAVNESETTIAGQIRREVRSMARNRRGVFTVASKNTSSWVGTLVIEVAPAIHPSGQVNLNEYLIQKGYVFRRGQTP